MWMFSSLSGRYRWTFVADSHFLHFSLSGGWTPRMLPSLLVRAGGGRLSVIQVVSIERLYVLWTFVIYIRVVSYFSIVY